MQGRVSRGYCGSDVHVDLPSKWQRRCLRWECLFSSARLAKGFRHFNAGWPWPRGKYLFNASESSAHRPTGTLLWLWHPAPVLTPYYGFEQLSLGDVYRENWRGPFSASPPGILTLRVTSPRRTEAVWVEGFHGASPLVIRALMGDFL